MFDYTIIIPHKNIPKLLDRCLSSIPISKNIQVIIVDDNSDNNIVDFDHFPGNNRLYTECYFTKEGRGAGYARNVGLSHAKGKWLLFADADDFFIDGFVDILDKYKSSEYDIIVFPVKSLNSDTLDLNNEREKQINTVLFNDEWTDKQKLCIVHIPSSKIIKHKIISENSIQFEEIPFSNDVMFTIQSTIAAKNIFIDKEEYIYNLTFRNGSLTTRRDKTAFRCRFGAELRKNSYLRKKEYKDLITQINKNYLYWASDFGTLEVMRTIWILFINNMLFFKEKNSWENKYYNFTLYYIYKAFMNTKK